MVGPALELGPRVKRRVKKVVDHARKRKNWYRPQLHSAIPGHDKRHQCMLGDFRCVFSYTVEVAIGESTAKVFRHLSLSTKTAYPTPLFVEVIAVLFEFTGSNISLDKGFAGLPSSTQSLPESWSVALKGDDPIDDDCVIVIQDTGIVP